MDPSGSSHAGLIAACPGTGSPELPFGASSGGLDNEKHRAPPDSVPGYPAPRGVRGLRGVGGSSRIRGGPAGCLQPGHTWTKGSMWAPVDVFLMVGP